MRLRRLIAAAALTASILSSAARAEDEVLPELSPTRPIAEVAVMLAYDYCPKILGGAMTMYPSWELQQLSFGDDLTDRNEPEFDYPLFMIEAARFDGRLGYASRTGNGCEVIGKGENRAAVREALKTKLLALPVGFKPDPAHTGKNVESYTVTQNNVKFYARLKDNPGDDPETILQLSLDGCSTCKP